MFPALSDGSHVIHQPESDPTRKSEAIISHGWQTLPGRNRRQIADDRGQMTEDRGQKAEDRGQMTEGRGQKAEGRGQRADDGRQRASDCGLWIEGKGHRAQY